MMDSTKSLKPNLKHLNMVFSKASITTKQAFAALKLVTFGDEKSEYYTLLTELAMSHSSSLIRREATSYLGRMKDPLLVPTLYKITKDVDPKVSAQALRGLTHFISDPKVEAIITKLTTHKNEMIRESAERVIKKRQSPQKNNFDSNHILSPNYLKNLTVHADTEKVMDLIPDESIHLTFTSPPYYNARDYSFYKSYEDYLDFLERVFSKVHRITKEGRFLIINTSPIIVPRVSRAHASKRYPIPYDLHNRVVKDGLWEFIDDIVWQKPEASVKNRVGGFFQHRKPLGYKPNTVTEMVMVYRKKTDKLLDWNMRQYPSDLIKKSKVLGNFESTNIWKIDPQYTRKHSAIFPKKLCEKIITYYSYRGDLVFDPFAGSGTFGKVAFNNDRYFLQTELDNSYIKVIEENLSPTLWDSKKDWAFTPRVISLDKLKELSNDNN